jgi:hypothetical protein
MLVGARGFTLLEVSQMSSGAYSAFHSMVVVGKAADQVSSLMMVEIIPALPPYAFMACIKL